MEQFGVSEPQSPVAPWIDFDAIGREAALLQAKSREEMIRTVLRGQLPKRLRWLIDHPRLLGFLYKVRPKMRPVITVGVDGDTRVESLHLPGGQMVVLP